MELNNQAPEGRLNGFMCGVAAGPAGLARTGTRIPALKRRAILACPCGTGAASARVGDNGVKQRAMEECRPNLRAPCLTPQGDCAAVIAPKVSKLRKHYFERLAA